MTRCLCKRFSPVLPMLLWLLATGVVAADAIRVRADAPTRYEVVEGDTLWDISGQFLEDPWLWPEVWQINPQIENPHLIYPGDIIQLVYSDNGPVLTLNRGGVTETGGLPVVRLSPRVRREAILSPIPAIPRDVISAFLNEKSIVSREELESAPYLLENRGGNLMSATGSVVFARGNWDDDVTTYDIVRSGQEYSDPATGDRLGYEAIFIGSARIIDRDGDNATLTVGNVNMEVRKGDRFIPRASNRIDASYFPIPPAFEVDARIVDIESGHSIGSIYDTLVINKGSRDRLEVGHLLSLQKPDIEVEDTVGKSSIFERFARSLRLKQDHVETFSGETYASVLVYRVFENSSLAIVLDAEQPVRIADRLVTP